MVQTGTKNPRGRAPIVPHFTRIPEWRVAFGGGASSPLVQHSVPANSATPIRLCGNDLLEFVDEVFQFAV